MSSFTYINNLVQRIAKEQNYENCDIKLTPVTTDGANYSSMLYAATISSQGKDDIHLFIKVLALSKETQNQLFTGDKNLIERETAFYTYFKKAYDKIEEKYNVPEEYRLHLPKYYGSEVTPDFNALVMENLVIRGFGQFHRFKSMDWEYASKATLELVKLHALSIKLQIDEPEEFKRLCETYIIDPITESIFLSTWLPGVQSALSILDDKSKSKYEKFVDEFTFSKIAEYKKDIKVKVIAHGDYRPSNLVHKVKEGGSVQVVPLDHQTLYLGSPICDLLYLIASATDKTFRDHEKLVELYYTQLSDALRRLDIDPEKTYSKKDFYDEFKEKLPFGLITATFSLPFITVESKNAPELKADLKLESLHVTKLGALYPERMQDIVNDFIKWGVLTD